MKSYNNIIDFSGDTVVGVSATTLSGGTIFSGSTDLSFIFAPINILGTNNIVESSNSAILGGYGNKITSSATGSTILGGSNITGSTADTAYIPQLQTTQGALTSIPSSWKFGDNVTGLTFTLITNNSLEVEVGGVTYKLAIVS